MGNVSKPVVTYTENGTNGMSIKSESLVKTTEISFEFGKEFDEVTPDGREVKSTVTKDAENKLTHVQKHEAGDTILVREISGNIMNMTVTAKGITAHRKYERV